MAIVEEEKCLGLIKHGKTICQRCKNPDNQDYKHYGGRGIVVCEEWLRFENFLGDMGERPGKNHSIDRIDNNGNYCKSNCRWATQKQQMRNMRKNRLITFDGKTQCVSAWAEGVNISQSTLYMRIFRYNWSIEKAITTPVRKCRKHE